MINVYSGKGNMNQNNILVNFEREKYVIFVFK